MVKFGKAGSEVRNSGVDGFYKFLGCEYGKRSIYKLAKRRERKSETNRRTGAMMLAFALLCCLGFKKSTRK